MIRATWLRFRLRRCVRSASAALGLACTAACGVQRRAACSVANTQLRCCAKWFVHPVRADPLQTALQYTRSLCCSRHRERLASWLPWAGRAARWATWRVPATQSTLQRLRAQRSPAGHGALAAAARQRYRPWWRRGAGGLIQTMCSRAPVAATASLATKSAGCAVAAACSSQWRATSLRAGTCARAMWLAWTGLLVPGD
jgi:hypothetical protein